MNYSKFIILKKCFVLSYILEPNLKIYYISDFIRVLCTQKKDDATTFDNRDSALKAVKRIKKITKCEFQIEEV